MAYWFPSVPGTVWSGIFLAIIFFLNFFSVKGFGEGEYWFSMVKVATVIIFIIVGLLMIFGILTDRGADAGWATFTMGDAPFAGGLPAIIGVAMIAGFSFQGTELVGVAAGESDNPGRNIPRAIKQIFWRILLFYVLAIFLIGCLIPYTSPSLLQNNVQDVGMSPFTLVFQNAGLAFAASVMNAVILTAILSAGNSGMYASTRMLYNMALSGMAPKVFGKLTPNGVPRNALYATTVVAGLCFFSSMFGNQTVYLWLLNISGMSGFTGAFEKLGTTPQEARSRAQARYLPGSWDQLRKPDSQVEIEPSITALILADEMYGRVHQRFHRGYADMVRKSNYSDIFLVDLNGDVVYSVTKHPNFATNLLSGPYQGSGLGQTFAKIKRRLDGGQKPQQIFEFTDFGRNELTGQVVAYMAAPVMQYDYVRGVVIFELLPDKLNQIMAEREGLGETGETILIGPDKRMRADAWLAPEFSVENSFSPNFRPLQTPLITKTLSGEQGVGLFHSYQDDEVLAAYTQVKVFDTEWAFIAEISTREAYAPIRQLETLVIVLGAGSVLLLILMI